MTSRIALLPAIGLTLASAVPAPTPQALAECSIGYDEAMAALKALPEDKTEDLGNGQTNHVYAIPKGMTVFGFSVKSFNAIERSSDQSESLRIVAHVTADYGSVVSAALEAIGKPDCDARMTAWPAGCLVFSRGEHLWDVGLGIVQFRNDTRISCTYVRRRSRPALR